MSMEAAQPKSVKHVPSYCYNCVSGPDLMNVKVVDGVATEIEPNFAAAATCIRPRGKVCVKAYGLVQKTYNPNRISTPMKRTNPKKGRNEDPGFVPISWDEALDIVAEKLKAVRAKGLVDEAGLPRVAVSLGHGGTPSNYMGTFPAFLAAWGEVDFSFGSGQGVKCVHSEHLYGEFWHRGFTVAADTPNCRYNIAVGANVDVTGGPCAVIRHADARVRGYKRVQVEPHLDGDRRLFRRVGADPAEDRSGLPVCADPCAGARERLAKLDIPFLRDRTASPYLVAPTAFTCAIRKAASRWCGTRTPPAPWCTTRPAPNPPWPAATVSPAPWWSMPTRSAASTATSRATAYEMLARHIEKYTPEWAETVCDVKAATIRRIANEYLEAASIGETIEIDGKTLPLRPVAVTLGKSVNNGWGAYECCWARTVLAALVGALENPGGLLGTTVRLNKSRDNRHLSVAPGEDGFMVQYFNPTSKEEWQVAPLDAQPAPDPGAHRRPQRRLEPGAGPDATGLDVPERAPDDWSMPMPTLPEVWLVYRSNPSISFWDTRHLAEIAAKFPFMACFAYTVDETNYMADVLLPEATDLESTQMIRMGGTKYMEQFWDHKGVVLRAKAVEPQGEARDFTWITTELAMRTGLLEPYVKAINKGISGVSPLKGEGYDFSLDPATAADPNRSGMPFAARRRAPCPKAARSTTSNGSSSTASTPCRCRA
jgi:phenylacetyl-CoA:acceptor oxidoreductase